MSVFIGGPKDGQKIVASEFSGGHQHYREVCLYADSSNMHGTTCMVHNTMETESIFGMLLHVYERQVAREKADAKLHEMTRGLAEKTEAEVEERAEELAMDGVCLHKQLNKIYSQLIANAGMRERKSRPCCCCCDRRDR